MLSWIPLVAFDWKETQGEDKDGSKNEVWDSIRFIASLVASASKGFQNLFHLVVLIILGCC